MKLAIIGASGKSGRRLTEEALRQGYDVTAIVRNKDAVVNRDLPVLERDLFDLTSEDVAGFDAVIDAFKAPQGKEEQHITSMEHLIRVFEQQPAVRLMVVGGAGSLYTDASKTAQLVDGKDFPPAYFPDASNMRRAFETLQASDVNWTYLSPAAMFDPDGKRTGVYTVGEDVVLKNKAGESYVSYADFAIAMIDEVKNRKHLRKRFTIVSERS